MSEGHLERVVPHEMHCAIYAPYPHHSGKPCDCPVRIVRELEAGLRIATEALEFYAALCEMNPNNKAKTALETIRHARKDIR